MASVRKAAPARISAIMQYSRVPPSSDSLKVCQVSEPCAAEMHQRADHAQAAASVAVAMPL